MKKSSLIIENILDLMPKLIFLLSTKEFSMKKTLSIFMALLLCLQLSACARARSYTMSYSFPAYNEFIKEMEEKYPNFKMKITHVTIPSNRRIEIYGEIPKENIFGIFEQITKIFLTEVGYDESYKNPSGEAQSGPGDIDIDFYEKNEDFFFQSVKQNSNGDNNLNGFSKWVCGIDSENSQINSFPPLTINYEDGHWDENYNEYFGFSK